MNICIDTPQRDYLGLEVFDYLVGYWQYVTGYQQTPVITFGPIEPNKYNILFLSSTIDPNNDESGMSTIQYPSNVDQYDLIALDNGDEPFGVGDRMLYNILDTVPHARLLCNSILPADHPYKNRIINTSINWGHHRRYYVESVFPQSYELDDIYKPLTGMIYVNGRNRSVREFLTGVLQEHVPDMPHHNDLHNGIVDSIGQYFHETAEDTKFREWTNGSYANNKMNPMPPPKRWPPLPAGVEGRYGATFFEDRIIDVVRNNQTIVYPETTWQNGQIALTEKPLRCFINRKFSMPVGGAYTHQLYNDIGFKTVWHLLPPEHQKFDSILDHQARYVQQAKAIQWLWQNPEIFKSDLAEKILIDNQVRCMLISSQAGRELYNIINENS